MVTQPDIRPQRVPSGFAREVPTIRNANVPGIRNIPTVQPTGFAQSMRAAEIMEEIASRQGQQMQRLGQTILDDVRRERQEAERELVKQEREQAKSEREKKAALKERAAQDKDDREATRTVLLAGRSLVAADNAVFDTVQRAKDEYPSDPDAIAEISAASVSGAYQNMSEGVGVFGEEVQAIRVAPILENAGRIRENLELEDITRVIQGGKVRAQEEVVNTTPPKTPAQRFANEAALQRYSDLVDADPSLSPIEKDAEKIKFEKDLRAQTVLDFISTAQDPLSLGLEVLEGSTGMEFIDSMPAPERFNIFNNALRIENAKQMMQNRAKSEQKEARDLEFTETAKAVYLSDNPLGNISEIENMIRTSKDFDEVERLQGLKDYAEDADAERFTESDPEILTGLELAVAFRSLPPAELKKIILNKVGNGVSRDDFRRLYNNIDADEGDLLKGPAFELAKDLTRDVFPEAYQRGDGQNTLVMLRALQEGDFSSLEATPEENRQSRFLRQFMREFKAKARTGEYTEKALIDEVKNMAQRYQVITQAGATPITDVLADSARYDVARLNPPELRAFQAAVKDSTVVNLVDKKYRDNMEQVVRDLENNLITEEQARKIQAILLPLIRNDRAQ